MKKKENNLIEVLNKQYEAAENKEIIDYWEPLSRIILESITLRDLQNLSQADLAGRMKTTQSVISRFENMGRLPSYDFISRLANALGNKSGLTLYGDFMAVVPPGMQKEIKKLADLEKISTSAFVQNLLEISIKNYTEPCLDFNKQQVIAVGEQGGKNSC